MDYKPLDHSVNIIAYKKDEKNYAMCCAWCMMADYDKLLCLLGAQSVTGNNIKKGDIIGVSSLKSSQKDVALQIGDGHSDMVDKLKGINYYTDSTAVLIEGSKSNMKCEVIDVLHLEGIEVDNLLYLKIIDGKGSSEGVFLHAMEV